MVKGCVVIKVQPLQEVKNTLITQLGYHVQILAKKMFNVTVTKNVEEYLGCRIDTSRKGEITVHQPHIYKHLQKKFKTF